MSPMIYVRGLSLTAALVLSAGVAAGAPAAKSGVFVYETQRTGGSQPSPKRTQQLWIKGNRVRVEMTGSAGKMVMLELPEGTYTLSPGGKEAMKMPRPAGASVTLLGQMERAQKMKKVGSEKVGGYQASIHEETVSMNRPGQPKGQIVQRIWISPALPVPVKTMLKTPQGQITSVLKSAKTNVAIPDSMFQLPKGVKIREMPMPTPGAPATPRK